MQTWETHEVPEKWKSSPDSIKVRMPGWKHVLLSDSDRRGLVAEHFPEYLYIYDGFRHNVQRADIARYVWLYVHGGLYLDLDYEVNSSLEPYLLGNGAQLFFMNSQNINFTWTNSVMASRPGHPFWLDLLRSIKTEYDSGRHRSMGKHAEVMNLSGPGIFTKEIQNTTHQFTTLPQKALCPYNLCDYEKTKSPDYAGVLTPLEGCSWGTWDTMLYNWVFCNYKTAHFAVLCMVVAGVLLLLFLLAVRWYKRNNARLLEEVSPSKQTSRNKT